MTGISNSLVYWRNGFDSDSESDLSDERVPASIKPEEGSQPTADKTFLSLQLSPDLKQADAASNAYQECNSQIEKLLDKRKTINCELNSHRKRQKVFEEEIKTIERQQKAKIEATGISWELWSEYRKFAADIAKVQKGTCRHRERFDVCDANDSYYHYDPQLQRFLKLQESYLFGDKSWLCERVLAYTKEGNPMGYYADYYHLYNLGNDSKWSENYPNLYLLAKKAGGEGSSAALDMLVALPDENKDPDGSFFEFGDQDQVSLGTSLSERFSFVASYNLRNPESPVEKRKRLIAALGLRADQ
ncbi:hypothetical protein GGS20DRAFT_594231 [Poronia punctata]|nr:hypothetical protein GGS20DRAFT_594231 [Poronia punctata]